MDGNSSVEGVTGAILAGGRATRFHGINKATLSVDGRRIIDRQLDVLRATTIEQFVVGGRGDSFEALPVAVIADEIAGAGPLGGLLTALNASRTSRVVVIACDMPFVTEPFIRFLIACSVHGEGARHAAVVPRSRDGLHPLCAVYSTALAPAVADRIATGRLALRGLVEDVDARVLGPEELLPFDRDGFLLANVNTPADLLAIDPRRQP
ncbi:MAG: molybdenum cofactor guanylyltransferase [Vicinamibacterales bacterium]